VNRLIFWNLIDASRRATRGDPEQQIGELKQALLSLTPNDIVAFDRILSANHNRAYSWDLWGAAYLIGGGCSDDGFMDFRGWLISRGENVFEAALVDPETLVKVVKNHDGECQIEGFQYVAGEAWQEITGKAAEDFPRHDIELHKEPLGAPWSEEELEARYPKLFKKFG